MSVFLRILSGFSIPVIMSVSLACVAGPPSEGARDMPGAAGTIEFKPDDWHHGATTWWKDSEGIAPGIAGCHLGTDSAGYFNGRMFGEACLPDGRLVETNPGAGVLHNHKGGLGHPDTFDCNAWCKGNGASEGTCSTMPAPPCAQSAMCACQ